MRLESCFFAVPGIDQFPRLARVLEHTARKHCPNWQIRVRPMDWRRFQMYSRVSESNVANVQKIADWCDVVVAAPDGDCIALLDTDPFIVNPLDPVWKIPFDVAYTARPNSCVMPINAGVVFVRVSPQTREFFLLWRDENIRMLADGDYHEFWMRRYGGINQAALGAVIHRKPVVHMVDLPCVEWNCEDTTWSEFDDARTRIVHVKSGLRRAIFNLSPATDVMRPLVRRWRALEHDANRPAA